MEYTNFFWTGVVLMVLFLLLGALTVYLAWKLKWFEKLSESSRRFPLETRNPKGLQFCLEQIEFLSFPEKIKVLQSLMGVPISIGLAHDRNTVWIRYVLPLELTKSEENIMFNKSSKDSGIG